MDTTAKELTAQTPAVGVLKTNDWGDTKTYFVQCDCGQASCSHDVWVEAEDTGVNVTIYATLTTRWNEKSRWKQIWQLLTKGYTDHQTSLYMDEQTTLNYSATLQTAMKDVKELRKATVNDSVDN
jgi:hypothetical protein